MKSDSGPTVTSSAEAVVVVAEPPCTRGIAARWRAYLRDPARNPDARFRRLAEALARTPPGETVRELAAGRPGERFAERWLTRGDDAGVVYAQLDAA
jgi:hypothetical protein